MERDFKKLIECIKSGQNVEVKHFILELASALREELHASVFDVHLLNIFDESHGLLFFIEETVNERKFGDAIVEALEILCTLVNSRTKDLVKYTPRIRRTCLKVIMTSNSDAKQKRRALELLEIVLQKTDFYPGDDDCTVDLIYEKLYVRFLGATGGVLAAITTVLGVLIKKYPSVVTSPNIFNDLVNKLERLIRAGTIQYKTDGEIAGYFQCLSDLLEAHPDHDLQQLYRCIKDQLKERQQMPFNKKGHRACMMLIKKHTHLFSDELYSDMWWWQQTMSKWLELRGDDSKTAYATLDAIHEKISKRFISKGSEEDTVLCSKSVKGFTDDINNPLLYGPKLRLAIRGLGFFADAAKAHLPPDQITTLFIDVVHRIEKMYLLDDPDSNPDQLENLPDYVQTLSNILKLLENLTDYEIGVLEQATVLMIRLFPHLQLLHHNLAIRAVLLSLVHLRSCKKEAFNQFLQNVVYQGIIWTCSHSPTAFAEIQEEAVDVVTYKKYLPLWYSLLSRSNEKIHDDKIKLIMEEIFDELMKTLFVLINKLNLSTQLKDSSLTFTDPGTALEAVKASDFDIFFNIVDLYVDILKEVDSGFLKKWMQMFINQTIMKANKYPLVSGFYKLLSAALKICNNLDYFEETRLKTKEDIAICYDSVCSFVRDMILKIKLYKGDLQIACLYVLLSAPISLIREILPNISSTFTTLFTLGRNNLKLAELGIDALEHWYQSIPQEELERFLKEVLPSLDSFLTSKSLGENFDTQPLKTRKTKQILNRRRIVTLTEAELYNLQKRILVFLSHLNSDLCSALVESENAVEPVTWSKSPHLKVTLPYEDIRLNIYLDNLVPRIVELSLNCTERQVRINACEVLHSIVILILGTSFSMNETKAKDLNTLLKKISYPLLQLGCDPDQTVRDIFQPLMVQLMHWYSSPQQKCSTHSAIIIETLMDGVTQSNDTAIRDFTCTCIQEFIKWTIKQTTQTALEREPINVKVFVRKIRYFSLHTDPSKRLAAALIFNSIYTILREETAIFNIFWLELLHSFVMNLSLVDEHDQYNCLYQVEQCLQHLERGFVEKCGTFRMASGGRRIPPNFDGGLLRDVAVWLLKQTGSINRHCRERCIQLFLRIAPLVDKQNNNVQKFMGCYKPFTEDDWISKLYNHYLQSYQMTEEEDSGESFMKWMASLLCALDGNIFVCKNKIAPPEYDVYTGRFYEALIYFLSHVNSPLFEKSKVYSNLVTTEKQHFKILRTSIIKKTINFLLILSELNNGRVMFSSKLQELLDDYGWNVFCKFIFEHAISSDDGSHEDEIRDLINDIKRYCPESHLRKFDLVLDIYITEHKSRCNIKVNAPLLQRQVLQGLITLQKSGLSALINMSAHIQGTVRDIFDQLIESNNGDIYVIHLPDSSKKYCELQLQFALESEEEFSVLTRYLCDDRPVKHSKSNELTRYGVYIFENFKHVLAKYILRNWSQFFAHILTTGEQVHGFIDEILRYVEANRQNFDNSSVRNIVEDILAKWNLLKQIFDVSAEKRITGLEMLEKVSHLVTDDMRPNLTVDSVYLWIVESLKLEGNLWSEQYALTYLSHVINALPLVLGHQEDKNPELENALTFIQEKHFKEIPQEARVAAAIVVNKAFKIALLSKSRMLFKFSSITFTLAHLNPEDVNIDVICRIFIRRQDKRSQVETLHCIYDLCSDNSKVSTNSRYGLAKDILINLVRYSDYWAFERFFVETIKSIMSHIRVKSESLDHIMKKTVAYILIKVLFSRIDMNKISNESCPITKAACPEAKDGRALIKGITAAAAGAFKETAGEVPADVREYFRIYLCHCYNALVCIISTTQTNSMIFKILFCREVNGENVLWRKLIDDAKNYTFEMDFDKLPTETKTLVGIRTKMQTERKNRNQSQTVKYIESQHLFNSTLSEDVCQYDLTHSVIRSQPLSFEADETAEMVIDIDSVEINSHECMATICGLIRHMVDEGLTPEPDGTENLPDWMEHIKKEIADPDAPRNVKLFLVKVIEIMQSVFKPYAKQLFKPVTRVILDGHAGANINYFVADLVLMLISWSENAFAVQDRTTASELLQFLMKNVNSDRADIMKYHLELIKTFVEPWKRHIDVPRDYIFSKLSTLTASKKVDVVVHLCATLLANNLAPWDPTKVGKCVKHLCKILDAEYVSVYRPCAVVVGMALKHMHTYDDRKDNLGRFEEHMIRKLRTYDDNKRLYCLQEVMKYYPSLCDPFVSQYVFKYKNLTGDFKAVCLKMFLERIETLHASYEFSSLELGDLVSEYNAVDVQIVGLEIILKSVPILPAAKLSALLGEVCRFVKSTSHICRSIMYDILMVAYNTYDLGGESPEIVSKCKDVLLMGLVDHNAEIEEKVKAFWLGARNLPKDVFERFTYILDNMYKPATEGQYLGYFIYFLLSDLTQSEDFSRKIFDYQLSECLFSDYNINDNWRARHVSLAPMFASTYKSLESEAIDTNYSDPNFLRATQTLMEFEPTLQTQSIANEKWNVLKGTSYSADEDEDSRIMNDDAIFKVPYPVSDKTKPLKRRFQKDRTRISRGFAFREVEKASKVEDKRRDLAKQREQSAHLYRKYRTGDFPDIEIKLSDVIVPLEKLAKSDTYIARQFYTTLFQSIFKRVTAKKDGGGFVDATVKAINNIFISSVQYTPNVMGAFLDIALTYKDRMQFQPDVLSRLAQYSGLVSMGSLLLEEYLISGYDSSTVEKRERGYSRAPEVTCWVKLAELYKEMEEWDVVRAIFLEKMDCNDTVLKAIDAESQGFWRDAQAFYCEVIGSDESLDRKDFYYESYYKCFAELSDWDSLSRSIRSTVSENEQSDYWNELWDQDWNQQKLLPWYITAELRNSLRDDRRRAELLTNLNAAMNDPVKAEYIKANFCEELAFLWLTQDGIDKAKYYLNDYVVDFLNGWSNLNPLLVSLRSAKIIKMRNAVDIYDFVGKLEAINGNNFGSIIGNMCNQWLKLFKENLPSIVSSETRNVYRGHFIEQLKLKMASEFGTGNLADVRAKLDDMNFDMDMNLVDVALNSNNFYVARKYFKKNEAFMGDEAAPERNFACSVALSRILQVKALHSTKSQDQLRLLTEAWSIIGKYVNSNVSRSNPNVFLSTHMLAYDLSQSVTSILTDTAWVDDVVEDIRDLCVGTSIRTAADVGRYGFQKLQNVLDVVGEEFEHLKDSKSGVCKSTGDAYLKLAYFAYNDRENYTEELIRSILKAMYYGSSEAKQIFPCLLNISNLGTAHKDTFLEESIKLPEWMYIQWIPQLLANMDSKHIFAIHQIITNIARKYPQAIMYAYRLSKQKYTIGSDEVGTFCRTVIETLDRLLLSDPLVDKLLAALSSVSHPTNIVAYYIKKLSKACNANSQKRFREEIQRMRTFCGEKLDYDDVDSIRGAVFKTVFQFTDKLSKLDTAKFDANKIRSALIKINEDLGKLKNEKSKYRYRLSYYSPWLEHFSENELNLDLEIPGQYRGDRKPLLQYHVKISGFSSEVSDFKSLRSPIKLTFIGNDAKEHQFIVKFGEDLRQDQRIEQMFSLVNNIFNNDPVCHEKRLSIRTYQVIPLTSNLGLIECVADSVTLNDFVEDNIPKADRKEYSSSCNTHFTKYLGLKGNQVPSKESYDKAVLNQSPDKTVAIYRGLVNSVPWDIFRKAFWNESVSPESFVALRHKFITSYSVACIADWILGIGDRHLSNSMVSLQNGQIIDIDFGHAFGSATQILPIPELVPFRLTPHIVNLMQPLNEHGLIQETMVHILRALRKNNGSLLATMHVFIKEPSLEWLEFMDEPQRVNWCPEVKISQARRKLEGANPAVIMVEELSARTLDSRDVIKKYIEYVRGSPKDNVRARKQQESLSVEDQVKCLLDHATDYNLLGRMYYGWGAWV